MTRRYLLLVIVLAVVLAACEDAPAEPLVNDENAPVLVGDARSLPKQLVTVELSPTPDAAAAARTPQATTPPPPTDEPLPLDPTRTPTPFVGVFVGTAVEGTPGSAAVVPGSPNLGTGGLSGGVGSGVGTTPVAAPGNCPFAVADTFAPTYTTNESITAQLGCPQDAGTTVSLVHQPFERGSMYWRDTRQIYALQPNNVLQIVPDTWQESIPASDPAFSPPSPNLFQPVRGFGFVWRSNEGLRNALGWATQPESFVSGFWQNFENGVIFQRQDNGNVFVLVGPPGGNGTFYGPF
jgi:hypothetical protein